jgi:hypothetical protein
MGSKRGKERAFLGWWLLTIVLGGLFMYGTGREWHRLIYEHGLTIATNLFGTTYYSWLACTRFTSPVVWRCCRSCCSSVWPVESAAIRPNAWAFCRCTGISWTECG